jgi:hypothetical protein
MPRAKAKPKAGLGLYEVTHYVHRLEYCTVTIRAASPEEALEQGRDEIDEIDTAEYEPGDVVGSPDDAYEVQLPDGTRRSFTEDGEPYLQGA